MSNFVKMSDPIIWLNNESWQKFISSVSTQWNTVFRLLLVTSCSTEPYVYTQCLAWRPGEASEEARHHLRPDTPLVPHPLVPPCALQSTVCPDSESTLCTESESSLCPDAETTLCPDAKHLHDENIRKHPEHENQYMWLC